MTSPFSRVTVRAFGSSATALVARRISTWFSRYHSTGFTSESSKGVSPRRKAFDSGGRSYG